MNLPLMILLFGLATVSGLDQIREESNPGKRAEKAIQYSDERLTEARELFRSSNEQEFHKKIEEVAQAAELALSSLEEKRDIGRTKKVEKKCRAILRRIETFKLDLPVEQRSSVEKLEERIHHVQDELVNIALRRKKK